MLRPILTSIALLFLLYLSAISQSWKSYPYHETGSELYFPADEGYHPGQPIEWWYTNAREVAIPGMQVQVFPNPATDKVNVWFQQPYSARLQGTGNCKRT